MATVTSWTETLTAGDTVIYPFVGTDEERRSISFNARIDNDLYNVYE